MGVILFVSSEVRVAGCFSSLLLLTLQHKDASLFTKRVFAG